MILCCGEALIDFLPVNGTEGKTAFQPFNGGSIYNVAIALGRLGRPVGFFGGLSTDFFGQQLTQGLRDSGVDLAQAVMNDRPSTLAFVRFNDGEPEYAFFDEGSVGRMLAENDLTGLPDEVTALHFGSISLIHDPAGATLEALARQQHGRRVVSFDPNIRPGQIKDREAYMRRFDAMMSIVDIVKLSNADLAWIAPNKDIGETASTWLEAGAKVVTITRGAQGAIAYHADGVIECGPPPVRVADTIGAGDTFMAGLLAALDRQGVLTTDGLSSMNRDTLTGGLEYAARAASVTVSRPGADPPWEHEI